MRYATIDRIFGHYGIGNRMISGAKAGGEGVVESRERLGGLLKYYHRRAA
jgi:hypothetical protein